VLINVDNSDNVTYKEYAYNSVANAPINAGEVGSSVVLVTSITVQGQDNNTEINTAGGSLQMLASVLPSNADDNSVTWSVTNETGAATINTTGLLTAVSDGTVTVTATANDGSGISGSIVITISNQSLGFAEINANKTIEIYPNPVKETFRIKGANETSSLKIYNLLGKEVKEVTISNVNDQQINISDLNNGIYLLYIFNNNEKIYSQKIIKE
jgi:uncharacterized protein YjdB